MTDFPRGRVPETNHQENDVKRKSSTTTTTTNSKGRNKDTVEDKSNKKRRKTTDTNDPSATVTTASTIKNDFLFGNVDKGKNNKGISRDKSRTSQISDNNHNEYEMNHMKTTLASNNSLLPIGGGGVIIPTISTSTASTSKNTSTTTTRKKEGYIESISFTKLSKGVKLLGIIREIHNDVVIFSLPNMWTGYMLRSKEQQEISYHDIYHLYQMMSVIIVKAVTETTSSDSGNPKRRIQVTCTPDIINPNEVNVLNLSVRGQIISIEDHGLLIDLGFNRRGFLKFNDIEGHYDLNSINKTDVGSMKDNMMELNDDGQLIHDNNVVEVDTTRLLNVNRILDFIIKEKSKTQIMILKLPKLNKIAKIQSITPFYKPTIHDIQPGMLVPALVELAVKNGICVTFGTGGIFRGSIEISHLDKYNGTNDAITTTTSSSKSKDKAADEQWKKYYMEIGRSLIARIIAVDPVTKLMRLSLLPHIISMNIIQHINNYPRQGTILDGCKVIRIDDSSNGVLLALPSDKDTEVITTDAMIEDDNDGKLHSNESSGALAVYVHISKAFDDKQDDVKTPESVFHKMFTQGTLHTVRILQVTNLIENLATGGTAQSIVDAHLLDHSDLIPGKLYKQVPVCKHIEETGAVIIDFGMGVKGLIPLLHMFDHGSSLVMKNNFRSKVGKVKYSVGAKVDVRVLYVDNVSKKCYLTAKKPLVKASTDNILSSYESAKIGNIVKGFVSKVDKNGLWITFFNRVYGRVTARSLQTELGIENPIENYHVGDVLECRIVNIKKWNRQQRGSKRSKLLSEDMIDDEDEDDNTVDYNDDDDLSGTVGSSRASAKSNMFRQLTLSLKLDNDIVIGNELCDVEGESQTTDTVPKKLKLQSFTILPTKSMRVKELVNGKQYNAGAFTPGYAIVSIKTKHLFLNETTSSLATIECKLPYDQLLDEYESEWVESATSLDEFASKALTLGKKINKKGIVVVDPIKLSSEYVAGTGRLIAVSIRPMFVEYAEKEIENASTNSNDKKEKKADMEEPFLPNPHSSKRLYVGACIVGYVNQIHPKHGAFVRFLNDMSGLVPKKKGGLLLPLFRTMVFRITAIDEKNQTTKISLVPTIEFKKPTTDGSPEAAPKVDTIPYQVGDIIEKAEIVKLDFQQVMLKVLNKDEIDTRDIQIRLHCTAAEIQSKRKKDRKDAGIDNITSIHPFFGMDIGDVLSDLHILNVAVSKESMLIDVTNVKNVSKEKASIISLQQDDFQPGEECEAIVSEIMKNGGLHVIVNPVVTGYVPPLEVSEDIDVLDNLQDHFEIGTRITGIVVKSLERKKSKKSSRNSTRHSQDQEIRLSLLPKNKLEMWKPTRGEVVIGRINNGLQMHRSPALMIELRNGYTGRCCITEINDTDSWVNMPMERLKKKETTKPLEKAKRAGHDAVDENDMDLQMDGDGSRKTATSRRKLVKCCILDPDLPTSMVEVSLRQSRLDGDLSDDDVPDVSDVVQAYVVETNKKGCFVRCSRQIEGRAILKEVCDGFLPNPDVSFPPGRLVIGKIKQIKPSEPSSHNPVAQFIDIDMRESVLEKKDAQITLENVQVGVKYKGLVERIQAFGVFVRIQNSNVSGLVHISECSDSYIKNLSELFQAGDLVKVLVLKADKDSKRISLSMKASHFEEDSDSEDDDDASDSESSKGESSKLHANSTDSDNDSAIENAVNNESDENSNDDEDSDDGNEDDSSEGSSESSETESIVVASEDVAVSPPISEQHGLDTDVGFEWEGDIKTNKASDIVTDFSNKSDSDSDDDNNDDDKNDTKKNKSRKKQALRRREQEEISKREKSLADGTADENPETAADFERLLAGAPNSSEIWIRYMAFHLSLADVQAARDVANRAIGRIEFRQEKEKMNIWSALLTLELKYGTESSVQETVDRASQHSNPKHVYLRTCEICSREALAGSPDHMRRADEMFAKMCKKFKDKKKVWVSHFEYLLQTNRHEEAHALSKRALLSLPKYKQVETMAKFAQLVFEFGKAERARTLFDGLLQLHPKRLDLFFVYVDKEVKFGDTEIARSLFQRVANPNDARINLKLTDKQMKSFFKKWFSFEQEHGTDESQDNVKNAAREYVERITESK